MPKRRRRKFTYNLYLLSTHQSFFGLQNVDKLQECFRRSRGIPDGMRKVCTYHNKLTGYKTWTLCTAHGYPVGLCQRVPKREKGFDTADEYVPFAETQRQERSPIGEMSRSHVTEAGESVHTPVNMERVEVK